MFYYLSGELTYKDLGTCVIDCSGVGYKLTVSQLTSESLAPSVGKRVKLFTYLAVREDGVELFGFGTDAERSCFNRLITVSGVGPKAAISILSILTPEDLAFAIHKEDAKAIAKANGVGAKTAARIILELKDKIGNDVAIPDAKTLTEGAYSPSAKKTKNIEEAEAALISLGYDKTTVANAIKGIDGNTDVGDIIRLALRKLSN